MYKRQVLIDTVSSTRLQLDSAGDMRGRVLAAQNVVAAAAGAVGAPLLGWLCEHLSPGMALVVGGLVTLAATLLAISASRRAPDTILVDEPALAAARA